MAKPELGAKRQCQACAAKFFDMNRDPIVCPKCGTVFQGATMRADSAMAKDEEAEDEPAAAAVEMVSLDEVEAAEEKAADPVVDDIDVEDDETAEDTFLEEEEEDEDDVSSLIDGEIAPDEEP